MRLIVLAAALLIAGCATSQRPAGPQDQFLGRLLELCGKSFEGRIVSPPVAADSSFAGKRLVMHVRDCSPLQMRIPFHVGDDRSRTWVITRTGTGLKLKHDHRHDDGTEDRLTPYGGETVQPGTVVRQEFPADAESKALFAREKIPQSSANVWAVEVTPRIFAYELRRPGRFFRVEFDLTRPVPTPPPAWGSGKQGTSVESLARRPGQAYIAASPRHRN
jgi:hypothetical protein